MKPLAIREQPIALSRAKDPSRRVHAPHLQPRAVRVPESCTVFPELIESPEPEVRRVMATSDGYDAAVWAQLNDQLGVAGLAVPEEFGGSGFTFRSSL